MEDVNKNITPIVDCNVLSLLTLRKERSAKAARQRRNKENVEYDKVKALLPIDEGIESLTGRVLGPRADLKTTQTWK